MPGSGWPRLHRGCPAVSRATRSKVSASAPAIPQPAISVAEVPSWLCSAGDDPHVSIVLPFFNRVDEVEQCVSSLFRLNVPRGQSVEIIAIDNGSTDGTLEKLQTYPIKVLTCATRGPAAARNVGWKSARARLIAFTDSDCAADPQWLQTLLPLFTDPTLLFAGGYIEAKHIDTGPAFASQIFGFLNNEVFFRGNAYFPPFLATANVVYRRVRWNKAAGLMRKSG